MKSSAMARLLDEDFVERLAGEIGPASASARALTELKTRRAAGDDVVLIALEARLVIIPREDLVGAFWH